MVKQIRGRIFLYLRVVYMFQLFYKKEVDYDYNVLWFFGINRRNEDVLEF